MPKVDNSRVYRVNLEFRNNIRKFFECKESEVILDGPAGTGKALSLDTEVPTIAGWKTMGTICKGDTVFDENGQPVRVLGVSPVMENHRCYRVEFSDGSCVKADAEHLWEVFDIFNDYKLRVVNTDTLIREWRKGKRLRWAIRTALPVDYQRKPLQIDPYVLGCWLGDGDSRDSCFTCGVEDRALLREIQRRHYIVNRRKDPIRYNIPELLHPLRALGLLNNKHIPDEYLQASVNQRFDLLCGLMDTDGTCCKRQGTCEFTSTKKELADGVYELVCSLGIKATLKWGRARLNGRLVSIKYRVCFTTDYNVFRLARKQALLPVKVRPTQKRRYITKIVPIESEPVRCIKVDSSRGLFLVTRSYIPTHNTRGILERQHLIQTKYPRARGLIVRKFRSSMNETVLEVLKNAVFCNEDGERYPDAPEWKERDQKYVYSNGSEIVVAGMDDPQKALSSQYDWFYWNEAIEAKRGEWEALMSRLRNFKVPYQQAIGDTNPGPPTHWINQMAIAGKLLRMPTTHHDNPVYWDERKGQWTPKGEMYVNKILRDSLTGLRYKRLYEGKWVAAEGQVYPDWNPAMHIISRRPLPRAWPRYWVFDFGYVDPFVWQEWVENPDTGQMILHREIYHTSMNAMDGARAIREFVVDVKGFVPPYALICDHDAEDRSMLERELGMMTLPAYKAIHPGIAGVQARLKPNKRWSNGNAEVPGLVVMENANLMEDPDLRYRHKPTCTVEEAEGYVWDTGKMSQDKYKDMPVDKDNHGMDAMRYAIAFVDSLAVDPQEREAVINYNDLEAEEWEAHWQDTEISRF